MSSDNDSTGLEKGIVQQEEAYQQRKTQKRWLPDIRNTPCARSALINGILGGLAVGILYFAKTSIVRRSCDFAVGGFALIALTSWEVCRYQKAKQRVEIKQNVKVLNSLNSQRGNDGVEGEETRWQLPEEHTQTDSANPRT